MTSREAAGPFLFTGVLMPRLRRLGRLSPRVEPRDREIGLLDG